MADSDLPVGRVAFGPGEAHLRSLTRPEPESVDLQGVLAEWDRQHPRLMPATQALAVAHLVLEEKIRAGKGDPDVRAAWATMQAIIKEV